MRTNVQHEVLFDEEELKTMAFQVGIGMEVGHMNKTLSITQAWIGVLYRTDSDVKCETNIAIHSLAVEDMSGPRFNQARRHCSALVSIYIVSQLWTNKHAHTKYL